MNKSFFCLAVDMLFCITVFAQTPFGISNSEHYIQAGDSLYKYQVEYKDPGSNGRQLEWDFSHLQLINDNYLIKYFYPDKNDTSLICGMEHRTRYYYRQRNDSLWASGFENYTTKIDYIVPELKLIYPFVYGDTLFSHFDGKGKYSNMLDINVKGNTRVKADAEGILKLPELTTRALRVHTQRYYSEAKTKRGNRVVKNPKIDSLRNTTNGDTLRITLDTYSWYVKDIRYPVFESIKTTIHEEAKDTTVFHTSFYYTPEELTAKNPQEEEIPEIERVFTEAAMQPNPVVNDLLIEYKLTRPAIVWFSVHNNIGQPMRRTNQRSLNTGQHNETIPMGGLPVGTYTVYVHVDDMVMSRVLVKR